MTTGSTALLEQRIRDRARELGFDPVGITSLGPSRTYEHFVRWLENGHAGEMSYLHRSAEKRRDFCLPFPNVRSAVVVGLDYGGREPAAGLRWPAPGPGPTPRPRRAAPTRPDLCRA